jgi:DNA-binding ferritin-like protein (Dps family)
MALTTEQQAQVDVAIAIDTARNAQQAALQAKQTKLEAIRLAKETLIENARSKPADARDVTAADITAFADALVASINA